MGKKIFGLIFGLIGLTLGFSTYGQSCVWVTIGCSNGEVVSQSQTSGPCNDACSQGSQSITCGNNVTAVCLGESGGIDVSGAGSANLPGVDLYSHFNSAGVIILSQVTPYMQNNNPDAAEGYFEGQCTDNIDNDLDAAVDCADAGCTFHSACFDGEVCGNGQDDDGDGSTDCDDLDCKEHIVCQEDCGNGEDDNGNGLIDCMDTSYCHASQGCEETLCDDGVDNDNDGLIDCEELSCSYGAESCNCSDNTDNDNDGLRDCEDPDCAGQGDCGDTCTMWNIETCVEVTLPCGLQDTVANVYLQQAGIDSDLMVSTMPESCECTTFSDNICDEECAGTDPDCCSISDNSCNEECQYDPDCADVDGDGYDITQDCDDQDSSVNPGELELCDGKDTDCDGDIPTAEMDLNFNGTPDCKEAIICEADGICYQECPEGIDPDCTVCDCNDFINSHCIDVDGNGIPDCWEQCFPFNENLQAIQQCIGMVTTDIPGTECINNPNVLPPDGWSIDSCNIISAPNVHKYTIDECVNNVYLPETIPSSEPITELQADFLNRYIMKTAKLDGDTESVGTTVVWNDDIRKRELRTFDADVNIIEQIPLKSRPYYFVTPGTMPVNFPNDDTLYYIPDDDRLLRVNIKQAYEAWNTSVLDILIDPNNLGLNLDDFFKQEIFPYYYSDIIPPSYLDYTPDDLLAYDQHAYNTCGNDCYNSEEIEDLEESGQSFMDTLSEIADTALENIPGEQKFQVMRCLVSELIEYDTETWDGEIVEDPNNSSPGTWNPDLACLAVGEGVCTEFANTMVHLGDALGFDVEYETSGTHSFN